ncbi:uncharacterized protein [Rutidosis leptorrhynchoides]|uniref:uncharacterized protein n=1 Tax=Rutidosis leptorrhynchoides TaxID=125765 RepID=UPI003A9A08D5
MTPPRPVTKLTRPEPNAIKVNVDGALFADGMMGIGVAIKDHDGRVLCSRAIYTTAKGDIQGIEALAILVGLELASFCKVIHFCIESDASNVVKAINGQSFCFLSCCNVIDDARSLASSFDECNLSFVRREGNNLAHSIANSKGNWQDGISSHLYTVTLSDLI